MRRDCQVTVALWGQFVQLRITEEPRLSGRDQRAHFGFSASQLFLQITEAQTVEGLFNVLAGLRTSARSDTEHVTLRDILLQLPFAEENSAVSSLRPRTHQQDVGSVASTLK